MLGHHVLQLLLPLLMSCSAWLYICVHQRSVFQPARCRSGDPFWQVSLWASARALSWQCQAPCWASSKQPAQGTVGTTQSKLQGHPQAMLFTGTILPAEDRRPSPPMSSWQQHNAHHLLQSHFRVVGVFAWNAIRRPSARRSTCASFRFWSERDHQHGDAKRVWGAVLGTVWRCRAGAAVRRGARKGQRTVRWARRMHLTS